MLCLKKEQKTCWIFFSPSLFLLLKLENIWFRTNYGYAFEGLLLCARFVRRRKLCVFEICWTFSLVNVISRTFSSGEIYSKDAYGWYVKWRALQRVINDVLCCYKIPLYAPASLLTLDMYKSGLHNAWSSLKFRDHQNYWKNRICRVIWSANNARSQICLPSTIIDFNDAKYLMGFMHTAAAGIEFK